MKIIYHGHSFVEIETNKGSILIDPFINGNTLFKGKIQDFYDKKILATCITHGHNDHIGSTIEISLKTGCKIFCSFELGNYFKKVYNLENIFLLGIGGEIKTDDYSIKLVSAIHGTGVGNQGSGYTNFPTGVIIRIEGKNIYHAGDTALTYDMKLLGDYDNIDIAFLPIGGNFTMGINDAVIATSFIKPKKVIPIHYNTFDLIQVNPDEFIKKVGNIGYKLGVGESLEY